jgi:hypothetical protein
MDNMIHFYFGCVNVIGHYHWTSIEDPDRRIIKCHCPVCEISGILYNIDGLFVTSDEEGLCSRVCLFMPRSMWTIISFADYSVDRRPASNSNFIFEGNWTFQQSIELIEKLYLSIFNRFTFELKQPVIYRS